MVLLWEETKVPGENSPVYLGLHMLMLKNELECIGRRAESLPLSHLDSWLLYEEDPMSEST